MNAENSLINFFLQLTREKCKILFEFMHFLKHQKCSFRQRKSLHIFYFSFS